MLYTLLTAATASCSTVGAALVVSSLSRDARLRISSVRWLLAVFFAYLLAHTAARAASYAWLAALLASSVASNLLRPGGEAFSLGELDRLGLHALLHLRASSNGLLVAIVAVGDVALFGASFWAFPLTYELSKLLSATMDRGGVRERARIRLYAWAGHALIAAFAAAELALALTAGRYSRYAHSLLLSVYAMQMTSLAHMVAVLAALKLKGRDVESVHGQFVASPVYRRLKIVYASFALEFQIVSLVVHVAPQHAAAALEFLGVSAVLFMATALALALVTGCSLRCFLRACPLAVPVEMRERLQGLMDGSPAPTERHDPLTRPVFVFTDIESSSALWAIDNGQIMQQAVQVHDDVLRALLAKHRGYEITTAGDSFQLAFHTIREAAAYCLEVQTRLLAAEWPRELHGLVPATARERQAHRYLFRGLRVRMGIHDAAESEGRLVVDAHAVTGKTTYTGTSEVIASTVGDLGAGGQILVTRRVAEWLEQHRELMPRRFDVEWLSPLVVPQLGLRVELFELLPSALRGRRPRFT